MDEKQLNRPKTRYYVQSQNRGALAAQPSPTKRYVDNSMDSIKQNYQAFLNNTNYPVQSVTSISKPNFQQVKQIPVAAMIHNPSFPSYNLVGNHSMQGPTLSRGSNFPVHRQPIMQNRQGDTMVGQTYAPMERHIPYPSGNMLPQNNIIHQNLTALSPKQRMAFVPGSDQYNTEIMRRSGATNQVSYVHNSNLQESVTNQMVMNFSQAKNQQFGTQGSLLQNLMVQNTRIPGSVQVMHANVPKNVRPDIYKAQPQMANYNMQYDMASQAMQQPKVENTKIETKSMSIPVITSKIKDEDLLQFTALGAKRKINEIESQPTINGVESLFNVNQMRTDSDESFVANLSSSEHRSGVSNVDFLSCITINKRCRIPDKHKLVVIEYKFSNEHYSAILKHLRSLPISATEHPKYVEINVDDLPLPNDVSCSVLSRTNDQDNSNDIDGQVDTVEDKNEPPSNHATKQEKESCGFLAEKIQLVHETGVLPMPIRNYENLSREEVDKILNIVHSYNCKVIKEHKLTKYRVRTFIHADGTTQNQFVVYTNITDKGTVKNTILHQFGVFNVKNANKFKSPLFSVISCGNANPAFLLERGTNQAKKIGRTTLQPYQTSRSFDLYCEQNNLHFNMEISRYNHGVNPQGHGHAKIAITCSASQLPLLLGTIHST